MKIILNLIKILLVILVMFILTQNADQNVSVSFLTLEYPNINLVIVIIISLAIGAVFGATFMAFSAIQAKAEVSRIKKSNKALTSEIERLRNVTIEEIPPQSLATANPDQGSK